MYALTSGAAFPVRVPDVQQLSDAVIHGLCKAAVVFTPLFTAHTLRGHTKVKTCETELLFDGRTVKVHL